MSNASWLGVRLRASIRLRLMCTASSHRCACESYNGHAHMFRSDEMIDDSTRPPDAYLRCRRLLRFLLCLCEGSEVLQDSRRAGRAPMSPAGRTTTMDAW